MEQNKNEFLSKKHIKEDLTNKTEDEIKKEKMIKNIKKKEWQKKKRKEKWYQPKINSNIYISNLPKDITQQELSTYFSKCGVIRKDPITEELKIKIYLDPQTNKPKGDALISYLREESVELSITILNDTEIRPGYKIKIEPAVFQQKGETYIPRTVSNINELQKFKNKTDIQRTLGWCEEDQEKGLRIVIFENMFTPEEFELKQITQKDIEMDIIEECKKKCGIINKCDVFDKNPKGIVKIKFATPKAAEDCIKLFDQRKYNGRIIKVYYWDGKTNYFEIREDEDENNKNKRMNEFGDWLEKE